MRLADIKSMVKEWGPRGFVRVLSEALEGRDQMGREVPKIKPEQVSFRVLWEAMVGPVEETLEMAMAGGRFNYVEMQEAVDSTMFPSATGVLIAAKVIEGYEQPGYIGDQLVTVMPSKLKSERIVGFSSLEGPMEVGEGMPYAESGVSEKYVTTDTSKKGRILELTEEAIYFDQTGQILMRAQRLGEQTRLEREEVILAGVLDAGGSAGVGNYKPVYRPAGVATALYSSGNTNYLSAATPLVDWTDIDEALQYHAVNVKDDRAVSAERRPIVWMPKTLLIARKLWGTGSRILSATEVRVGDGASQTSQVLGANPIGTLVPGLRALSSPLIDYISAVSGSQWDDNDDWLIGDFQKQFVWQEIWPVQTFRAMQNDEAQFRRDIVARFKVRYYGGIAAVDTKYVIKVNAV